MADALPVVCQLGELSALVIDSSPVYLRYSSGPDADTQQASRDYESGLDLPGLSVVPLVPPAWWTRPVTDWLARQICRYDQLATDGRRGWVLAGTVVGYGPDHEPLLADPRPLAVLGDGVLERARRYYEEHFDVGADSGARSPPTGTDQQGQH